MLAVIVLDIILISSLNNKRLLPFKLYFFNEKIYQIRFLQNAYDSTKNSLVLKAIVRNEQEK